MFHLSFIKKTPQNQNLQFKTPNKLRKSTADEASKSRSLKISKVEKTNNSGGLIISIIIAHHLSPFLAIVTPPRHRNDPARCFLTKCQTFRSRVSDLRAIFFDEPTQKQSDQLGQCFDQSAMPAS